MRNTHDSINLWPIQFSDYTADTRKLNVYNNLRQTPIITARAGGVRARPAAAAALALGVRRL